LHQQALQKNILHTQALWWVYTGFKSFACCPSNTIENKERARRARHLCKKRAHFVKYHLRSLCPWRWCRTMIFSVLLRTWYWFVYIHYSPLVLYTEYTPIAVNLKKICHIIVGQVEIKFDEKKKRISR
jgi:hypothetical protein